MTLERSVFVDTAHWLGIMSPSDQLHERAVEWEKQRASQGALVVTTDWVLAEVVALAEQRAPARRAEVLALVKGLLDTGDGVVVHVSRRVRDAALARLLSDAKRRWSWVDATSIVVMEKRGLTQALTDDEHFREAGFVPLLGLDPKSFA